MLVFNKNYIKFNIRIKIVLLLGLKKIFKDKLKLVFKDKLLCIGELSWIIKKV